MKLLLLVAGALQIAIAIASIWIPNFLNFHAERKKLRPILSQLFWSYAIYIFGFNLFFGLTSVLIPESLLNHSSLAIAFTLLISLYWLGRIFMQFFYLDKSDAPKGPLFTFANWALSGAFIYLVLTYVVAFLKNIRVF